MLLLLHDSFHPTYDTLRSPHFFPLVPHNACHEIIRDIIVNKLGWFAVPAGRSLNKSLVGVEEGTEGYMRSSVMWKIR